MHPNLFQIGPLTIHSYGVFLALGFLIGLRVAVYYAKRENLEPSFVTDLVIYIFIAALVGAKLLLIVVDFNYYRQDWSRLLTIYQVGGVYYGGFIFALLTAFWYIRKRKMDFWRTSDAVVMGLTIGQAFGRMGCFFAGCCWGKEAPIGFPLAVTFSDRSAAEQVGTPLQIPLHPSQLYESLPLFAIFAILVYSYKHRKFVGQQLFVYLLLYSILRFTVEFFRGDPRGFVGAFSTSQIISLMAFCGAFVILFLRMPRRQFAGDSKIGT